MKELIKKNMPFKMMLFFYRFINGNFSFFLWLFPVKKNKIVICNFHGKPYGDNGKYIANKLMSEGVDCEIVWLIDKKNANDNLFPGKIKKANYKSLRGLYELSTAKIWIDNCRKDFYPPKRKGQFYIQTWHGGIALKKIEKDVETKLSDITIQIAKHDSKIADLFVSNSDFCTELYRNAFWYNGEIIECGSPRCDILLDNKIEVNKKVRDYFKVDLDANILIYAPTFRSDLNTKPYGIDFENLIKVLEKKYGGKWVILVRLHPNISEKSNFMKYTSSVINATNYDDMYELLALSDILVTDYSSTMFEFSMTNKPVILYAPDIESYLEDRNFYFDIHSLPYPVVEDNHQLFEAIENFNSNVYAKAIDNFFVKLGVKENGDASKRIVEKIKQVMLLE